MEKKDYLHESDAKLSELLSFNSDDYEKDISTILLWEVNSVSEALNFLNQFSLQYDKRRQDERQKIATWPEIYGSFFYKLGMNPKDSENKKWALNTVVKACNQISGTKLQDFYSALDKSNGKVHEFLKALEAVFIKRWFIKSHWKRVVNWK